MKSLEKKEKNLRIMQGPGFIKTLELLCIPVTALFVDQLLHHRRNIYYFVPPLNCILMK